HSARERRRARTIAAVRCRDLGQARGGLQACRRQRGTGAGTAGERKRVERSLQHADALDPGSRVARSTQALWGVPPSPWRGDAERYFTAPGIALRQGGDRAVCRADLGLLAPAVLPVLPAFYAL